MNTQAISPFPIIHTERLILRELQEEDAPNIHLIHSDEEANIFTGRKASSGIQDALQYIQSRKEMIARKECIIWAISMKENSALIGTICLWNFDLPLCIAELGYELIFNYRRKGYISESITQVLYFGFKSLQAEVITALPAKENEASIALLNTLGFQLDSNSYNNTKEDLKSLICYSLKRQDYCNLKL